MILPRALSGESSQLSHLDRYLCLHLARRICRPFTGLPCCEGQLPLPLCTQLPQIQAESGRGHHTGNCCPKETLQSLVARPFHVRSCLFGKWNNRREKGTEISCQLIYSPDACNCQAGSGQRQGLLAGLLCEWQGLRTSSVASHVHWQEAEAAEAGPIQGTLI